MVWKSLSLNLICHYFKFTIEEVSFQIIHFISSMRLYTYTNTDIALLKCIDSSTRPVILKNVSGFSETYGAFEI